MSGPSNDLVYDLNLLQFYENYTNRPLLLLSGEHLTFEHYFGIKEKRKLEGYNVDFLDIWNNPEDINSIMVLGNGRLSIAGFHLNMIISGETTTTYEFYFCCCDKEEQQDIVDGAIKIFDNGTLGNKTVEKVDNYIIITFHEKLHVLTFNLKIYKDVEDILMNIEDDEDKHLHNPKCGYTCTIVAACLKLLEGRRSKNNKYKLDISRQVHLSSIITDLRKIYVLLSNLMKKLQVNSDITLLLYNTWLKVLVFEVRNRLIE